MSLNLKSNFPIFNKTINSKSLVYLDSANSSQKPESVINRLNDFYRNEFSNVGRSVHSLAVAATNNYENTRDLVKQYINAKDRNEIVFTKGATEALNLVASTYGEMFLSEGDEVIVTELEHHSNYVPWHFLRKRKGIKIKFAEIDQNGDITLESICKQITNRTKVIAITHLSNVTGAILPIKEICEMANSKNIVTIVDGCQGAPHLKLDMQELNCDFYAISCHKMYGPTGIGILYGKKKWLDQLPPYQGGGGMISVVNKDDISYGDLPNKYEAGTMQTAEVVAFAESIKFIESIGINKIIQHEEGLINYALETLSKNNSVNIVGNPKKRGGVVSFTIEGIHPHDIATILDEDGIAIRAGHHCCQILHEKLNIPATARASFGVYNTKDDIDRLNDGINNCKKIFEK